MTDSEGQIQALTLTELSLIRSGASHLQRSPSPSVLNIRVPTAEREGNNLKGVEDYCLKNGSRQGQNHPDSSCVRA